MTAMVVAILKNPVMTPLGRLASKYTLESQVGAIISRVNYPPKYTIWWASLDSNQGPQSYQDCALTG